MWRLSIATTPCTFSDDSLAGSSCSDIYSVNSMNVAESVYQEIKRPGLSVWRIQGNDLVLVRENDHGFFHEETVYVLLKTDDDNSYFLHLWRGIWSTEADKTTAHDKCQQIDEHLGGVHIFSCEFQGHESQCFTSLFPEGIVYVEGNPKTTPKRAAKYTKRLYTITGRDAIRAQCVEPYVEELSSTGAAILDGFPRFYVWIGDECPYVTRVKTTELARKMRNYQRKGQVHIVVIDSNDLAAQKSFLKKLGLRGDTTDSATDDEVILYQKDRVDTKVVLHRLSGDKVLYDMPVVSSRPLKQKFLRKTDSYLLDRGADKPIFLWVGHHAAARDLSEAVIRGMAFSNFHNYPSCNTVCRIREGWETEEFKQSFINWHPGYIKHRNKSRCFSRLSSRDSLLPSRCENRTFDTCIENIVESPLNDLNVVGDDDDESTEIWKVVNDNLESVPWDRHGIFTNNSCYLILHHIFTEGEMKHALYYWLGKKSSLQDQHSAVKLSRSMNSSLNDTATVIRILDGKEPPHFMSVVQHSIIIYDVDLEINKNEEQMFSVRELEKGSIKVSQVRPVAASLSSSCVFAFMSDVECILWYGAKSGGAERDFAKRMLTYFLPSRMYTFDVILEGKEPAVFWHLLGGQCNYPEELPEHRLEYRQSKLVHCTVTESCQEMREIHSYTQRDLTEENVYLLDLFSQIIVWCGRMVNNEVKQRIPQLLTDYIDNDLAGRNQEDIEMWFVNQYFEPAYFKQYFTNWMEHGYGGKEFYELTRKKLRQENAIIHIHVDIDDLEHTTKPKYDPFILRKPELPPDVDPFNKQDHLSDFDFINVYKIPRSKFYRLPYWKQGQIIRSSRLYMP